MTIQLKPEIESLAREEEVDTEIVVDRLREKLRQAK